MRYIRYIFQLKKLDFNLRTVGVILCAVPPSCSASSLTFIISLHFGELRSEVPSGLG